MVDNRLRLNIGIGESWKEGKERVRKNRESIKGFISKLWSKLW